jgi:NAD(P)-dependent dehydrogenase (short-subunit alcohol dehydrogenase family)
MRLEHKVALVAGSSRRGGKGIALVLGQEGAVYVTGRGVRGKATTLGRPGTIEDTADEVTARGGHGILEYGFTDVDGSQMSPFWREQLEAER